MKAIKHADGTWRAQLSRTDRGQIESVQHILAGVRLIERDSRTADVAHTTLLGLETLLQERGPTPTATAEDPDAA